MTEKWIVDDAGTLINMETRENYDYMEEVVDVLNEKDKSIKILTNHNKEYVRLINILEDKLKKLKELEKNLNDALNRIEERDIDVQLLKEENRNLKKENELKGDFRNFINEDIVRIKKENAELRQELFEDW